MPRLAAISAENPAKLYGIHPKKGILQPGADADMVLVDLDREVTITNDDQITACGWTPYDSMKVRGWMTRSIIRGEVVMEDDQVLSKEGSGRFVSRRDA